MNCEQVRLLLSAYIDDELESPLREVVDSHLEECPDCRANLYELRQIVTACRSLGKTEVEPPEGLRDDIMKRLESIAVSQVDRSSSKFWRISDFARRHRPMSTVAAVLVLALFLRLLIGGGVERGFGALFGGGLKSEQAPASTPASGQPTSKSDEGKFALEMAPRDEAGESKPKAAAPATPPQPDVAMRKMAVPQESPSMAAIEPSSPRTASPGAGMGAGALTYDRMLVKRASYTIEVPKGETMATSNKVISMVEGSGGYVQSLSSWTEGGYQVSSISIRIPQASFNSFLQKIDGVGKVISRSVDTQDVTEEVMDLNARVKNKEAQEHRLVQILGEAKTVGEILQVENELNRVRTDIESIQQRLKYYENVTSMASVMLTIREEGSQLPGPIKPTTLQRIWSTFVHAAGNMLVGIAEILPYGLLIAVVYYGYLRLKK